MHIDDLYLAYDGPIPMEKRRVFEFGGIEEYAYAIAENAEWNFRKRCLETMRAVAAWRVAFRYADAIRDDMLGCLGSVLNKTRCLAIESYVLRERFSAR